MRKKQGQTKYKEYNRRKSSESLLAGKSANLDDLSNTDVKKLLHELRVHQTELEAQNEELRKAQLELQESRNKYAELYEFAPVGYFTLSEKGIILAVNLTGASLLGVERSNLIKRPFSQYVDKEHYEVFFSCKRKLLQTTSRHTCELRMLRKDRSKFYARLESKAIFDRSGNSGNIRVAILDITEEKRMEEMLLRAHGELEIKVRERTGELAKTKETLQSEFTGRRRAEKALVEKEEQYRNLFENVPIGLYRTTPDGSIIMANPRLIRMLGCSSFEELASHNLENSEGFGPSYPRSQFKELIEKEGEIRGLESVWTKRDGTVIFVRENARVARREDGRVLYYEGTVEDITEHKRVEEKLTTYAQQQAVIAKLGQHALVGEELTKLMDEATVLVAQICDVEYCKVLELLPEGNALLLRSGAGWKEGYVGYARVGSGLDSQAGYTLLCNEPVIVEDLRKEKRFTGPPLLHEHEVISGLSVIIQGKGRPFGVLGVHTTKERSFDQNDIHFVQAIANVLAEAIERKQAEERFRLVVESAPNGIVMVNERGEIVLVNSQTEKLFGYDRKELIGQSVEILVPERFSRKHSEYRKGFHDDPRARPIGAGRDLFALRKDGSEFPVEIGLSPIQTAEGVVILSSIVDITERKRAEEVQRDSEERLKAIMDNTTDAILVYDEHGQVITVNKQSERLFCGNDKKELKTIWGIIPPEDKASFSDTLKGVKEGNRLLDYDMEKILANGERIPVSVGLVYVADGGGSRFIETVRDIRERVALRNKLIELEKAQLIGRMAEGVAHHMGTPLASMLLRVQMLKEDILRVPEHEDLMEKLVSVERQVFYGQKVMQRLLRFAAKPEKEGLPDNVSSLLEEAAEMIKPLLKRQGIKLGLSLDENLTVLADANLLGLVFMDIMMNAVDAMPEGGKLSISVSKKIPEEQIEVVVSDTGTGISEDIIPFVFEPFFSTKPAGKGTGLGLSVAKRIIQDHGGEINLESTEGLGTIVWIRLPIHEEGKEVA
jgi:PAS domain S-box-containing protein